MKSEDILHFWFDEIQQACWWIKDEKFDQLIRDRFSKVHAQASSCELYEWRKTAEGRLAEIIILDQFSRNMFRDAPKSFESDTLSLALAQEAIAVGADLQLSQVQKTFLYMPFMHSESLVIHQQAVELYQKNGIQANLDFEIKHKDIIEKFGRYPHRNNILGRVSSKDEIDFLSQPNSSF